MNVNRFRLLRNLLMRYGSLLILVCIHFLSAVPSYGEICDSPSGQFPSIQSAIDEINCSEIALGVGSFEGDITINRSLVIKGVSTPSTFIVGRVRVEGLGTKAAIRNVTIVGKSGNPSDGLIVVGSAKVIPLGLAVRYGQSYDSTIFVDSFESGNTTKWSQTVP